jgi:class 3 adenylate cyclase
VQIASTASGRDVAFRVMSHHDGPTLLFTSEGTAPVDLLDEDPMHERFFRTVGRCGQLVLFDRPGIGASDPFDRKRDYGEQVVEAYLAVLDELGVDAAWVLGSEAPLAAALSRSHRSRIVGAVVVNPWDPKGSFDFTTDDIIERDGDFALSRVAPSRAADPAFRAWIDRAGRLGASAADARAFWAAVTASRFRAGPPSPVEDAPPVLIVRRRRALDDSHAEYWHRVFPDAESLVLEGADIAVITVDAQVLGTIVTEFVTGEHVTEDPERALVAIVFTDLVNSTEAAAAAGDAAWRSTLDRFEVLLESIVRRHGGALVKHIGDGSLATFPSGTQALEAAADLQSATHELGLEQRTGIHVGEVERRGTDIGGIAVHVAARVMGVADPGEIRVSSAVVHTTMGGRFGYDDLGLHELKGVDQAIRLFSAQRPE